MHSAAQVIGSGATREFSPPPPVRPGEDDLPAEALAAPVLIVEDEMMIAWRMQDLCEDLGFTDVRTAPDYAHALAAAEQRAPGLVICDINLGEGPDGIATARALRDGGHLPTVFITGYAGGELAARVEAAAPGAPLLHKPIEAERLGEALAQCLGRTSH